MRVAVTGATGRMGGEVIEAVHDREGWEVAVAVSRSPGGSVAGEEIADATTLAAHLEASDADVLVDFTEPESSVEYVRDAADAGVPVVVGTTGFDDGQLAILREASEAVPLLRAANFARGIQGLLRAVSAAVEALPGYDIELTETHHNGKRDAPSGTAKTILDEIAEQREFEEVYGREGLQPREEGEVGVHVRRAGDIKGEHEILIAGNDEVLTLTHRAESRGVFAAGSLDAADWLADRPAGWYDFTDVIQ